jgi:hypothetical protein
VLETPIVAPGAVNRHDLLVVHEFSPAPMPESGRIEFMRSFHVELLRGGMNRLLLRSRPQGEHRTRVEVLFQYVQYLDIPMEFMALVVEDATDVDARTYARTLDAFPECRVYRLTSTVAPSLAGHVVAASFGYGEDQAGASDESMFFMM